MNFFKSIFQAFFGGQKSVHLAPTHEAEPSQLVALPTGDPPWLVEATKHFGLQEIPGPRHNEIILEAHKLTTLGARNDETAWCSSIMCLWMKHAGMPYTRSAAARSWLKWGRVLSKPVRGCVVVFWRGGSWDPEEAGPGHVALYLGEGPAGTIRVRGGNQSNMVNDANYKKSNVFGYRWPAEYPLPK